MRAYQRQPGEGAKAFYAFELYRDAGPGRSLRQTAAMYYHGTPDALPTNGQVSNIKKWSARFDWVGRVRAMEDRDEMIRCEAIEEYQRTQAAESAGRRAALEEKILTLREQAADKALKMIEWPMSEQTVEQAGEDGATRIYHFHPARWTFATVRTLAEFAAEALGGAPHDEEAEEYDFSEWSEEDLAKYLELTDRLRPKRPDQSLLGTAGRGVQRGYNRPPANSTSSSAQLVGAQRCRQAASPGTASPPRIARSQ